MQQRRLAVITFKIILKVLNVVQILLHTEGKNPGLAEPVTFLAKSPALIDIRLIKS